MQANDEAKKNRLEAPGAGIPWVERKLIHAALKVLTLMKDKDALADLFLTESDKMIILVEQFEDEDLTKRVLIDRLRGIEDSSRDWSAMMVLDHLNIVNKGLIGVITTLLNKEETGQNLPEIKIEDVKPSEDAGVEMIDAFALNNQEVLEKLVKIQSMKPSKTHHHPWFGEFSAKQWLCLMAVHMKLHRKQIEKILDCSNKI